MPVTVGTLLSGPRSILPCRASGLNAPASAAGGQDAGSEVQLKLRRHGCPVQVCSSLRALTLLLVVKRRRAPIMMPAASESARGLPLAWPRCRLGS